jgi:hypothetical protein
MLERVKHWLWPDQAKLAAEYEATLRAHPWPWRSIPAAPKGLAMWKAGQLQDMVQRELSAACRT